MIIWKINRKHVALFILVILLLTGCEKNPQQSAATVILPAIPTVSPNVTDVPSVTPTEIPITFSPTPSLKLSPVPEPSATPSISPTLLPTIIPTMVPTITPVPTDTPLSKSIITTTTAPTEAPIEVPVVISGLDKRAECVSVKNLSDKDIDLTGWYIISVTGNQRFNFPDRYIIKAGAEVKVVSYEASGDLIWTTANMWNNSKHDPAELYNSEGELQSRWDD